MSGITAQVDILYKKYQNVGTTKTSNPYSQEASFGSARQRVYSNLQIFSQPIPATAPINPPQDNTFPAQQGQRFVSAAPFQYIIKYVNLLLSPIERGVSYWFNNGGIPANNLLSNSIAFNYDPALSYNISVSVNGELVPSSSGTYPWNFDSDVGMLTFFPTNTTPFSAADVIVVRYAAESAAIFNAFVRVVSKVNA